MMNKSDARVFVSQSTYKNAMRYLGIPIKNVRCIYNAFDTVSIRLNASLPCNESFMYKNNDIKK